MSRKPSPLAAMAALAAGAEPATLTLRRAPDAAEPYIPPPRSVWSIVERPGKKSQKKKRRHARRRTKR